MSDDNISYMSGDDLIARMRVDRAALAALWEGLTEAQMTHRPGPQSDWSVKDLIAHITWWERHTVKRMDRLLANQPVDLIRDVDAINARVFDENKDRALSDVLTEFDTYQKNVESLIELLSDDQINNPETLSLDGKTSILGPLINNTWGHYGDHFDDLKRYVDSVE